MPPPPRPAPPPHSLRVAVLGTYVGTQWANVFWVRNGAASVPSQATLQWFLNQFSDAYDGQLLDLCGTEVKLQTLECLYYTGTGDVIGSTLADTGAGANTGIPLPPQVALCIGWGLQQRYRGGHPRTYLPGQVHDSLGAVLNRWSDSHVSQAISKANAFHTQIDNLAQGELDNLHLGTVSFVHNKAWRSPPVFRDYIPNAATVDHRVDTQRRRLGPDLAV